jgi:catechol 2,3-dioxygenase-like lactoylglutathione lyase family enzyme
MSGVHELRLAVTAPDYEEALRFYRDVLGLSEQATWTSPDGDRVTVLEAGRATMELIDTGARRGRCDRHRRTDAHAVGLAERTTGRAGRSAADPVQRAGRY